MSGRNPVNIFGEPHEVRARVASIDSFSGHADKNELRRYVEAITGNLKKIAVIHGEEEQALAFGQTLRAMTPQTEVLVPEYQQTLEI
jgi:metallo-beta-lactamase family protein